MVIRCFLAMSVLALVSCDRQKEETSNNDGRGPTVPELTENTQASPKSPGPTQEETPTEEREIRNATQKWNDAHYPKKPAEFSNLFGESVYFYGVRMSGEEAAKRKAELLGNEPTFRQELASKVRVIIKDGRGHASFVKEATVGGKASKYRSYLEFAQENGKWVIVTEGDEETDRNLARNKGKSVGDFDGDGAKETVRLVPPKLVEDGMGCKEEKTLGCDCKLVFSDPKLPEIPIKNCIGGVPVNEGDLDDDGADEIGLLPWWFTSCWRSYVVLTLKDGAAKSLLPAPWTHCSQWEQGVDAIEKDPKKLGHVIVRSTRMEDFKVIEESISVSK